MVHARKRRRDNRLAGFGCYCARQIHFLCQPQPRRHPVNPRPFNLGSLTASLRGEKSMQTTNALITTPTTAGSWLRRWRWLAIAGVLIGAGTALALSQQWLAVA